jgi:hypothetical protein
MHTAPIPILPVHSTPANERHESHGEEFSIHLREDARKDTASDEPRSADHDERCCRNEDPRAPEKEHKRLSPDDDTSKVAHSKTAEDTPVAKEPAELSDPDAQVPNSDTALIDPEPATPPAIADPLLPTVGDAETAVLDTGEANAAKSTTTTDQPSSPSVLTAPALTIEGSSTPDTPVADDPLLAGTGLATEGEANLPGQKAPIAEGIATATPEVPKTQPGETSQTKPPVAAAETSVQPGTNGAVEPVAKPVIATTGGRTGGSSATGQTDGEAGSSSGEANDAAKSDKAEALREAFSVTTSKPAAGNGDGGQTTPSAGAGVANGAANGPALAADSGVKDIPSPLDLAVRGTEPPAQTISSSANQSTVTQGAGIGSEMKLTNEPSLAAETAAARNTPNAAANQVAVQINRAVQDGLDKFVVNLKPGTLGKVSVQLEVGHDNRVIAVISAERSDTLDLLQRDARTLEQALKEAGLKPDSGSLSFSLQGDGADDNPFDDPSGTNHTMAFSHDGNGDDDFAARPYHANTIDASGVDIHV